MSGSLSPSQFPQTLFHGTSHPIQGDAILPGRDIGHSHWNDAGEYLGEPSDQHAWASKRESLAWGYAVHSSAANNQRADPDYRARVHEVLPNHDMREGQTHSEEETGHVEYRAPYFATTGVVHDIMPGRQGTFPHINWQQFQDPKHWPSTDPDYPEDANHPLPPEPIEKSTHAYPNMHPKSHPTLPLGDIAVKQWHGRIERQSVDEAVHDVRTQTDRPYEMVTPSYKAMPSHRERYPNVY